jgi:hypothetical protein
MSLLNRRNLVRVALRLPVVAGIAQLGLFGLKNPISSEEHQEDKLAKEKRFQAVRILRLVNTAEKWHFQRFGKYANLTDLRASEMTKQLLDDEGAEKRGIGRSLYSLLEFDNAEIVPGWQFDLRTKEDGSGYVISIDDCSGLGLGAFASDQAGVIHEGKSVSAPAREEWDSASLLVSRKLETPRRGGRFASLLKAVAFGPVTALAASKTCCPSFPCTCFGSCESSVPLTGPGGGVNNCYNCGCSGCCVWCCHLF